MSLKMKKFYKKVTELNIPVFVHAALRPVGSEYMEDYALSETLGRGFGLALAITRFLARGILLDYPELKIVFAHLGGALPALKARMAASIFNYPPMDEARSPNAELVSKEVEKRFPELFDMIYFDTAGARGGSIQNLQNALTFYKPERIVFATDYPAEVRSEKTLKNFVDGIKNMRLDQRKKELILGGTAQKLLGIP